MADLPVLGKISRPRLRNVYLRARLFRWLDDARKQPIIWVVAPPGAGKTTLVASYVVSRRLPGAWYQLDKDDAAPPPSFTISAWLPGERSP